MGIRNLGSSIKSDANGLVGNIEKAVLIFPNATKQRSLLNLKVPSGKQKKDDESSQNAKTKNVLKWIMTDTTDSTVNAAWGRGNLDNLSGKKFTVQFNPSSIRVNARGGGRVPVSNFGAVGDNQSGTIQFDALDPYITVSFTVVFDALNQADAFMEERFTLGATTLVKNVATAAVGKEYTVRHQVEGFLAAIRDEDHRNMIFRWGKLTYAGVLNTVSGKYTMFNTAGNPIRAEVQIGMLMGGTDKDDLMKKGIKTAGYLYYWKKRYEQIINDNAKTIETEGGEVASSMSTSTIKQQFTNLLNL